MTFGGKASRPNEKFRAVSTLIGHVETALIGTYDAVDFTKHG